MDVEELIRCPKKIERKKRPKFREDFRHYRMDIELSCPNPNYKMSMFLRKSIDFPEDTSVGLKLEGPNEIKDQTIVLVRFQGPHGGQSAKKTFGDLHNSYHIHKYTQDDINCRRKKASYGTDGDFSSFEEAIVKFLAYCNIEDPNGIFNEERDKMSQMEMDLGI